MWCEILHELCQITDPVQIVLLTYLKYLFYVSESNKDKSVSELHFICSIAVETEGVWTDLYLLLAKIQTFGNCGLKDTEGATLTFITRKSKYVNTREAELWEKLNSTVCMPGEENTCMYIWGKKRKQIIAVTQKSFGLVYWGS